MLLEKNPNYNCQDFSHCLFQSKCEATVCVLGIKDFSKIIEYSMTLSFRWSDSTL